MKIALLLTVLVLGSSAAYAEGTPATGADAQSIDQACSADAQTAGCGNEQVGTGLMKCLHAYKKAHKADFKFSDSCKAAMMKAHQDHKMKKEG